MIIKGKLIGITRINKETDDKKVKQYKIGNFEYEDEKTFGKNVLSVFNNAIENKDIGKEFQIYKNKQYSELII